MAWKIGGKLGVGLILVKERVLKKGGKQLESNLPQDRGYQL